MMDERYQALKQHLQDEELTENDFMNAKYDDNVIEYGSAEYLVVTDEKADEYWDEELENYIEECILPELPEHYQTYFDNEKWKDDAIMDGRGHALSRYDGTEYEEKVNGTYYYIYRLN